MPHSVPASPQLALSLDLDEALRDWLSHLHHERGRAGNTLKAYERDVRQFLLFLEQQQGFAPCLADLERVQAKAFRGFLAARRRSGTVSSIAIAVSSRPTIAAIAANSVVDWSFGAVATASAR